MKKNYIGLFRQKKQTDNPSKAKWLTRTFAAAALLLGSATYAQTNIASYSFSKSTGATYTPITGGTKLFPTGTNTTYDNEVSSAITLSSPFTYGGVAVTSIYVSANGYVTFGAAPGGTNYTPLSTLGSTTGAISAFGQDAGGSEVTGAVPDVSYLDTATEFIVQYSDHANYFNRTQERLNFQIRLNYATGVINIVYGNCTNPGTVSTSGTAPQVGIRGNSTTYSTNVNSLMVGNVPTGTMCDWSKSVTGNANSSSMLFSGTTNVNVKIPNGLQYTWTPGTQLPVRTFAATTAVTNNGATLSWTAPTGATSYNVQYRALGDCDWTNFTGNPVSAATATLSGLTQNTTYQVQVQALNGTAQAIYSHIPNLAGTGNGYVTAGSFTTAANCASIVTGLASSALTPNTATISWTASTSAPGNGYEYYYSTSSTAPTSTTTPSGSVGAGIVTANLSGLTPATQYYYWVRGNCNGTDKGAWSSSANFTTLSLCPTVTAPVANATGVTSTNPTITWTPVNGATGYKVKVGTTSGGNDIADADVVGGTNASYQITAALTASTTYYYSVSAYTATTSAPATPCTIRSFTTACPAVSAPFSESFASGALPSCWISQNPTSTSTDPNVKWKFTGNADYGANLANNGRASGTYAWVDASTPYTDIHNVELLTPSINLTGLNAPYVSFDWFKNHSTSTSTTVGVSTNDNNKLTVDINNGSGWVTIFTSTTNAQVWRTEGIALASTYVGTTVQLRFTVDKNVGTNPYFYDDILLDNVEIKEAPACIVPNTLAFNNLTSTGATVTWAAPTPAPALGYDIYHSTTSTAPTGASTPQYVGVTGTSQIIPGTPGTVFYVWVRSRCSASSQSAWVGPVTYTIPYPAPANDNCSTPTAITPGANFAQNVVTGTTIGATLTTDATATTACQTTRYADTWYSVIVPASGSITIETKSVTGSDVTDTVLGVYTGTCGSLTSVGCNDDDGDGNFSLLTLNAASGITPGQTLLVGVWNYSATNNGTFQVSAYDASLSTLESVKTKNDIQAYPNPFADVLNISDISNVKSISVVDISGKLVKTFDEPESALHLRELNSGMYLVILNMKDGSKQTIKAIKK